MKMRHLLIAGAAALALGLAGCSSSSDDIADNRDMDDTPVVQPIPEPEPMPTDLEETQTAAAAAAAAAKTASDNAAASAISATEAMMTLATLQTGADSNSDAMGGREAAMAARAAAAAATAASKGAAAASAAAAAATTGDAAEEAWRHAVAARDVAVDAEATADTMAQAAIAAVMTELHIDGKDKSAAGSSLNADDPEKINHAGDGERTGRLETMDPMRTEDQAVDGETPVTVMVPNIGDPVMVARQGVEGSVEDPTTSVIEAADPKVVVEVRTVLIGRTLDTSDDAARLMLITHYAGTKKVKVFAFAELADDAGIPLTLASLTSKGEFYPVVADQGNDSMDELGETDVLLASAGPKEVFSYVPAGGTETYVVKHRVTENTDGTTSTTYRVVDITAALNQQTQREETAPMEAEVTAEIAAPIAYDHIHFGVWATLKEEMGDNSAIASLGIGFVQNHDVSGKTGADMPNNGMATYNGDWVATVQKESTVGDGLIDLEDGTAKLTANLDKNELTATLVGLATLTGSISGNTFSGAKVSAVSHSDLGAASAFSGELSGGFYGAKAAEAAGVFDFSSEKMEAGAFRGAFGGKRD